MPTKRTTREARSDDHDMDVIARLARIETEHEHLIKLLEGSDEIPGIAATLRDVNARLTKYETRWGMIVMLISALGAALAVFKDWVLERLR